MLEMLLESGSRSGRTGRTTRSGGAAVSLALHALVVTGAIVATMPAARRMVSTIDQVHVRYLTPPTHGPVAAQPPTGPLPVMPVPRWTYRVPTVAPPVIPPIQPGPIRSEQTVDPNAMGAIGSSTAPSAGSSEQVFLPEQVERPVIPFPDNAAPRYPAILQSAGAEGEVVAQFVVDTLGRVEPSSIKISRSSHDLFERAVREALARARYHPAQIGGIRVRQLVEQRFTFSIRVP